MKRSITATFLVWVMFASAQQQTTPARPQGRQPAAGQQNNNQVQTVKGGYSISVTSNLVVEDVILKDKQGNPIPGLTAKDFVITEDGKPQEVKICDFQQLEEAVTAAPEAAPAPKVAAPEAPKPAEAPVAKSVVATQIAPEKPGDLKYKDRRLLVMFFDMTSMPIQDQLRAQTAAQKFLKTQMTKSDLMAVMTFASDVKVVEDFTDDRDVLAKDIKNLTIGEGQGFDVTNSDDSSADTGAAFQQDDTEFNIFNTDRQLSALETAVKMLGSLNEKKALVYFASGMQKTQDNQAQLQATINAAIRSNVSFYPIDARGLVATAPLGDATKGSPGGQGMYTGSSARSATSNFQGQQETLYTLAADTGGKALLDNNDLGMGIVQAQKDISSYYILGYYPTNDKLDGQFRRVKITLRPELLAKYGEPKNYRQGYFAGKEFNKFTSSDKERQLTQALLLGDPVTDIPIAMEVDHFRLARDRYFVPITIKIPGSTLELAKARNGAESTKIDFIGQITDSKTHKIIENVRDFIPVTLKGEAAGQLAKKPLAYDMGFTLPPGNYSIKFLARENETGKMGTYETQFLIPDLTAETRTLPISSVVLSSQRMDVNAAVFKAQNDKKLDSANPLIEEGKKLVPSVTRIFNKSQDMYVYLQAYEPTADSTQPLIATVSFMRGKVKAFETLPLQVDSGLDAKSKALPLKFDVPLGKLAAGQYTCQVSVIDPSGHKFAFWRAPVMLVQ
ncbi:MAG TPA: VWA domain-containing protein [Candidatus Sulfopaludibacter sp.]|jgi:VWFA-related protein|nr:VWA domain-containing protein [Candidatus Sulfopaludibacter sp.]